MILSAQKDKSQIRSPKKGSIMELPLNIYIRMSHDKFKFININHVQWW